MALWFSIIHKGNMLSVLIIDSTRLASGVLMCDWSSYWPCSLSYYIVFDTVKNWFPCSLLTLGIISYVVIVGSLLSPHILLHYIEIKYVFGTIEIDGTRCCWNSVDVRSNFQISSRFLLLIRCSEPSAVNVAWDWSFSMLLYLTGEPLQ